jgi:alpha-glucosidase
VAVAEANVHPSRMPLYASEETLGQTFDFRFIDANFDAAIFKHCVQDSLELAKKNNSSTTWTLGNHDQMRYATKQGLHQVVDRQDWLLSNGTSHHVDFEIGTQCSVAANIFILALPGSTYIYQGDELGLHEVADIPEDQIQDPQYLRNLKQQKGRDGARVPLPWTREGENFGFGEGGAHLPQPDWFGDFSVEAQSDQPDSPLDIFRRALKLRRELQCAEEITWHKTTRDDVLHFSRPNGWHCITNFKGGKYTMPAGEILLATQPIVAGKIPPATTVWFKA